MVEPGLENITFYLDWKSTQYAGFMVLILGALEPRLFNAGEIIVEAGEDVDE